MVADLQTQEGVGIINEALRDHGMDIVINNAAVNPELGAKGVVSDMKEIEKVLLINTSSAIALCYAAFEYFKTTSKNGTIANINSVAGFCGSSREAIYAVSKFGLRGFSESVKEDWLKQGVRMIIYTPERLVRGCRWVAPSVKDLIDPREFAEFLSDFARRRVFL